MDNLFLYPNEKTENLLIFTSKKSGTINNKTVNDFNLGIYTNTDIDIVLKNIELLKTFHNINKLSILKQVHGNKVISITKNNYIDYFLSEADGLYTTETNIALGIFTADCYPVLLYGNKSIAALHCGWRSLNSSIIEECIKLFKDNNDFPKYVFIGPGICEKCYEVGNDMIMSLNSNYKPELFIEENSGKFFLNLKKMLEYVLIINNIKKYEFTTYSSCCSDEFYSYRKDNMDTGRMLSVIMRRSF